MITIDEWRKDYFSRLDGYYTHGEAEFDLCGDKIRIKDRTEFDPADPYADPEVDLFVNDVKVCDDPEFYLINAIKWLKKRYVTIPTIQTD